MTLLPLRVVLFSLLFLLVLIASKLLFLTSKLEKDVALKGWKRDLLLKLIQLALYVIVAGSGIRTKVEDIDMDYSYYLGKDYRQTKTKNVSTYVVNHSAWLDIPVLLKLFRPAFAAKSPLKKNPVMGIICQAIGCIFISRGASLEKRLKIIEQIKTRQEQIEAHGDYPPFVIFPEGGTSNNTAILPFKKGAFAALKTVKPMVLMYKYSMFSPSYDILPFFAGTILMWCVPTFDYLVTVKQLPDFTPNEYLFSTHCDKGTEQWEIYAWAVRDLMVKTSQLQAVDIDYREKATYLEDIGLEKKRPPKKEH